MLMQDYITSQNIEHFNIGVARNERPSNQSVQIVWM